MTRFIRAEGVQNLRDFGGYATACGRGVRRGKLFRSAHHSLATDADLEILKALGVQVVVDLRRPHERAAEPSRRWRGFAGRVVENDLHEEEDGWEAMLQGAVVSPAFFREKAIAWYRRMVFEPQLLDLFSNYFAALAETDGAVLMHCAAGRDRTGVLASLTLHAAGVATDDIVAEYLLTNESGLHLARAARTAESIERLTGLKPDAETVKAAEWAQADYVLAALDSIAERYGSIDAYLDRALGFDDRKRAAFEAHHLGPPAAR